MAPEPELIARFRVDLDQLVDPSAQIGIAVSGGPDSLALLLLAASARPGHVEAATVDHALRPESRREAEMVAELCGALAIPHSILSAKWQAPPTTGIQERAREMRYDLLGRWARTRELDALATAHHAEDQAETVIMRLARGAGLRGLGGMRPKSIAPGSDVPLIRPLLGWRSAELKQICRSAGLRPVEDPSNQDERFERIRVRRFLEQAEWLDPLRIAASASHLRGAGETLEWAVEQEWRSAVREEGEAVTYRPDDAPMEIRRRIAERAIEKLGHEGDSSALDGAELDRLVKALARGATATLRGVRCSGGREWRLTRAAPRKLRSSG